MKIIRWLVSIPFRILLSFWLAVRPPGDLKLLVEEFAAAYQTSIQMVRDWKMPDQLSHEFYTQLKAIDQPEKANQVIDQAVQSLMFTIAPVCDVYFNRRIDILSLYPNDFANLFLIQGKMHRDWLGEIHTRGIKLGIEGTGTIREAVNRHNIKNKLPVYSPFPSSGQA